MDSFQDIELQSGQNGSKSGQNRHFAYSCTGNDHF